jgi:hypothetical protein
LLNLQNTIGEGAATGALIVAPTTWKSGSPARGTGACGTSSFAAVSIPTQIISATNVVMLLFVVISPCPALYSLWWTEQTGKYFKPITGTNTPSTEIVSVLTSEMEDAFLAENVR